MVSSHTLYTNDCTSHNLVQRWNFTTFKQTVGKCLTHQITTKLKKCAYFYQTAWWMLVEAHILSGVLNNVFPLLQAKGEIINILSIWGQLSFYEFILSSSYCKIRLLVYVVRQYFTVAHKCSKIWITKE